MLARICLVVLGLALAACGVRGGPYVPEPMFGETDLPPRVPQPYDRDDLVLDQDALDYRPVRALDDDEQQDFGDTLDEEQAAREGADAEMSPEEDENG